MPGCTLFFNSSKMSQPLELKWLPAEKDKQIPSENKAPFIFRYMKPSGVKTTDLQANVHQSITLAQLWPESVFLRVEEDFPVLVE